MKLRTSSLIKGSFSYLGYTLGITKTKGKFEPKVEYSPDADCVIH